MSDTKLRPAPEWLPGTSYTIELAGRQVLVRVTCADEYQARVAFEDMVERATSTPGQGLTLHFRGPPSFPTLAYDPLPGSTYFARGYRCTPTPRRDA